MPEEGICQISHGEILTYDEIQRVCRCMTTLGIKKIKLTGGEPLTRKNSAALVRMLKELPGIEKVTLTTNGVLLGEQISELAEAGIDNINISLDTLNEEAFGKITRREGLPKVLESMKEALKYPQIGLKINCVLVIDDPQNLVEVGMGVSIISRLATTAGIQPDLAALPIADNNAFRTVCFVTRKADDRPAVTRVKDEIERASHQYLENI